MEKGWGIKEEEAWKKAPLTGLLLHETELPGQPSSVEVDYQRLASGPEL